MHTDVRMTIKAVIVTLMIVTPKTICTPPIKAKEIALIGTAGALLMTTLKGLDYLVDWAFTPRRVKQTYATTIRLEQQATAIATQQQQQTQTLQEVNLRTTQQGETLKVLLEHAEKTNTEAGKILATTSSIKEDTVIIREQTGSIKTIEATVNQIATLLQQQHAAKEQQSAQ